VNSYLSLFALPAEQGPLIERVLVNALTKWYHVYRNEGNGSTAGTGGGSGTSGGGGAAEGSADKKEGEKEGKSSAHQQFLLISKLCVEGGDKGAEMSSEGRVGGKKGWLGFFASTWTRDISSLLMHDEQARNHQSQTHAKITVSKNGSICIEGGGQAKRRGAPEGWRGGGAASSGGGGDDLLMDLIESLVEKSAGVGRGDEVAMLLSLKSLCVKKKREQAEGGLYECTYLTGDQYSDFCVCFVVMKRFAQ